MYKEAKVQQLAKLKFEYDKADPTGKKAIEAVIRQRHSDDNAEQYPETLGKFLTKARGY